ncbi:MAG: pilus assembly protein PilM [bacterium]|nr:pilus assembly protein PilM [candidate division WOR-3 bacterium]MDH5682904.1 pilus assembly protein PilM [candidate division WOR-3 bacterium]
MAFDLGKLLKSEGKGIISIDIGSNSVKFVKLEGSRITDYGLREIGETQDIAGAIRDLIRDYKPGQVFTFVSGPSVSMRQAMFPKMSRRELRDSIILRLDKYSPFALEEAILDFRTLGSVKEAGVVKDNVMVVAARKDIVSDHISTMRKAGLEPTTIGIAPFALAGAIRKFARIKPDENLCVLDIGSEFTNIIFMKGERLDLARTITTAGNAITEAMTVSITTEEGELSLDGREAEAVKRRYGLPAEDSTEKLESGMPIRRLATLQRSALERFGAEINRSIDYYKREFGEPKIDRMLICGGTALLKGIKSFFEQTTKIPTEIFDPFRINKLYRPGTPPSEQVGSRLVTSLGLLFDHQEIDLLPGELKLKKYTAKDIKIVVLLAIFVIPLLLIINLFLALQATVGTGTIKSLQKEIKTTEKLYSEYFDLKEDLKELDERQKLLRGIVGQEFATVPLMQRLSLIVPGNIQLRNCVLSDQRKIKINGIVSGTSHFLDIDLMQFMMNLERDPLVRSVELKTKNRIFLMGEPALDFEIETELE